jgi:putative MATE family efflux protein
MEKTQCLKEFVKYSSLNVLGMIGLSCYILADTFFVSKGLGTAGLAALNLAIPVYSLIHGSGLMLGMGGATQYSIYKECGKNTNDIFTSTVYAAVLLALVFVLAGGFFSGSIAALLGANDEIYTMTNTYLKVLLLFAPAFLLNEVLICFVRNDGNPGLAMFAMLGGSLSNVILDYLFIFPFRMGIFGAVFATGLAPVISMLILSRHWLTKRNGFHFIKIKLSLSLIRSISALGFPSLVTEVSSGIVMIVFNTILLRLTGNIGVAAYGVVANLSLVVAAVFTGIAQGIQPLVSTAHGKNDGTTANQILRYALITAALIACAIYLLIFLFADPIANVFNSEQNITLQSIACYGLRLYFISAAAMGFNIILSVFFASTEQVVPAHAISLLRGLILIVPLAFLLSALWGVTGVWLAFPVTEWAVALLGESLYFYIRKRSNKEISI